jgi:hypothetical protein
MRKPAQLTFCLLILSLAQINHAQQGASFGVPMSTTVYASFLDDSAIFRPSLEDAETLEGARNAALVAIRARTSLEKLSSKDEKLALARATAARSYLIARGVSPLKITLNYASATDFVADNSTAEGRMKNQRVEIDIVHVPQLATARPAVAPESIKPRTPTRAGWLVRKADQTYENMLKRWGEDVGWRVVWEKAPRIAITADGDRPVPHPEFLAAANYVVSQLKGAGYAIKAEAFDNNYLVITGE